MEVKLSGIGVIQSLEQTIGIVETILLSPACHRQIQAPSIEMQTCVLNEEEKHIHLFYLIFISCFNTHV